MVILISNKAERKAQNLVSGVREKIEVRATKVARISGIKILE